MTYKSYSAYLSVAGSTPSDYYKDYYSEFIDSNFEDTTSIKEIIHNSNTINARVVGIFTKESPVRRIESLKKIIFNDVSYEIEIGDYIQFDDKDWLCVDGKESVASQSYSVARCNNVLNIYVDGELHEIPCVIDDEKRFYDIGMATTRYLSKPDSIILCAIRNDEFTRQHVRRNNIYDLSDDNYEVIDVNRVIRRGLTILKLKWSAEPQLIPETPIPTEPSEEGTHYEISGDSQIRLNQTRTYEVRKYTVDSEGVESDLDAEFSFEILGNVPESAYELTTLTDNECSIKCKQSPYNITLKATDKDDPEGIAEIDIHLANLF